MSDYRAYIIDQDGHFADFAVLTSSSDTEAIKEAELLLAESDVEVWYRARKVTLLKPEKSSAN
jgi:hypothetical protein